PPHTPTVPFSLHDALPIFQGFDVAELVHVAAVAGVDPPGGERPEHERVVRVRTVRQMNRVRGLNHHASPSRRSPPSPAGGTHRDSPRARRTRAAGAYAPPPRS